MNVLIIYISNNKMKTGTIDIKLQHATVKSRTTLIKNRKQYKTHKK